MIRTRLAGLVGWRAALVVIVVASLSFGAWTALAQTVTLSPSSDPLDGSQFQGADGNQDNAPRLIDWQGLQADGRVGLSSDPQANDDIFTAGKELEPDTWDLGTHDGGATPGKDNVLDIYRAVDHAPGSDAFLYLAFTRFAATGDTFVTFELNQDARTWTNSAGSTIPCRTTGDILVSFEQGGNTATMEVQRWVNDTSVVSGPAAGCAMTGHLEAATNLTDGVDVQSAANIDGAITNYLPGFFPIGTGTIPLRQFGEAAINLTSVLKNLGEGCTVFGSTWMHSRSSEADTSAMHDYVAPEPLRFDTCKVSPFLTSLASGSVNRGAHRHRLRRHRVLTTRSLIYDTAILSEATNTATGTITFNLYGPNDKACAGPPAFTDAVAAAGNGAYRSGSFAPTAAGTYRWVVSYSGDDNNNAAGPTDCGVDSETVVVSRASPTLTSTASGPLTRFRRRARRPPHRLRVVRLHTGLLGEQIHDEADLEGGVSPTGTITFQLYGPSDANCSGPAVATSTAPVAGNGTYLSAPFTPTSAGTYHWVATYSGDANNDAAEPTACDDPNETSVVARATPTITTLSSGTTTDSSPIVSDTATLTGGSAPTGTITFRLYGPTDASCSESPIFTADRGVDGNGTYSATAPPNVLSGPGTYRWRVEYSGNDNNDAAGRTPCDDPTENVVVAHSIATTSLVTVASSSAPAGSAIDDTATLSGGTDPTGRITFLVYGPDDQHCNGPAVHVPALHVVDRNGPYTSAPFRPTKAGTYRWRAHYTGDADNGAASTACNALNESVEVTPANPSLSTVARHFVTLPGYAQDAATLRGGVHPRGTILFELFGPNNAKCAQPPVYSAEMHVVGNRVYHSPRFHPTAAGTYRWVATYLPGTDANNNGATTPCGEDGETTVVLPAHVSLTTSASPVARLHPGARRVRAAGMSIYDSAKLIGFRPIGAITFDLYGPNDASCSGPPIFTTATTVDGNGIYNSERFTPTASGTYRWRATYVSGDANNHQAGPTRCGSSSENVQVTLPADPSLITSASDAVPLGGAIHDTATLSEGSAPTGTITFQLYPPSDAPDSTACSGNAIFTSKVTVNGNGDYPSGSFTPTKAGAYRWVATYSGDHANHGASTACGDAGETAVVRPPAIDPVTPMLSTTASPPALGGPVHDVAHLSSGISPGGAITFRLFGPDDPSCSGAPAFTAVTGAAGNGNYRSADFVVMLAGTYRWVASYAGDAMNTPVATACGDPAETITVSPSIIENLPDGPNVQPPPTPKPKPKPKPKPRPKPKPAPPTFTG